MQKVCVTNDFAFVKDLVRCTLPAANTLLHVPVHVNPLEGSSNEPLLAITV